MAINYVKKEFIDELHQVIGALKLSLQTQIEENKAIQKTTKMLEDKIYKISQEKELYLTEVLKQKEKQVELLDQVNQIEQQASQTKIQLAQKEKELTQQKVELDKEKAELSQRKADLPV